MADDGIADLTNYQARQRNDVITEDGAALRFAELFAGKLRYCHDTGSWFEWSGTHWARNRTGLAFQWARELARDLARNEKAKTRAALSRTGFAAGVESSRRAIPTFAVTIDRWDQNPWLLGTPGGTVDLRDGMLRPSEPMDGITKLTRGFTG